MTRMLSLMFVLCMAAAFPCRATSSLAFEGGGYWIDMEIGHTDKSVVARVRFHAPGDGEGVALDRERLEVRTFDTARKTLVMRYPGQADGTVPPFELSVHGDAAVLVVGGKRIEAPFSWWM